jgi:hypothetical protein
MSHEIGMTVNRKLTSDGGDIPASKKPNIVFILTDNLGYGELPNCQHAGGPVQRKNGWTGLY